LLFSNEIFYNENLLSVTSNRGFKSHDQYPLRIRKAQAINWPKQKHIQWKHQIPTSIYLRYHLLQNFTI